MYSRMGQRSQSRKAQMRHPVQLPRLANRIRFDLSLRSFLFFGFRWKRGMVEKAQVLGDLLTRLFRESYGVSEDD